mmetsp:Transcript_8761/g.16537  ORF Transcript_8761/g.16537 Transcript_8761/m.16537 type:complete len:1050 (+) Transcript_8761:126-3275(+)|eukprot:CAMPEP_0176505568 /NCGR_PEP_ID=MMETSP0200_2-20121128/16570_1 /TAXON_ID=947934 /ORGANISM="Chaetoceros sp., Strain GSL56" /LENGTH=1049 /DNA_ID=CAMNT_0017905143 /DNA_START=45 /DNA_END=3194 /DNA_ORIENTATION=+
MLNGRNQHKVLLDRRLLLKKEQKAGGTTGFGGGGAAKVVLAEIIGATGLQRPKNSHGRSSSSTDSLNPFVIVTFHGEGVGKGIGSSSTTCSTNGDSSTKQVVLLQTTQSLKGTCDPIWCIEDKCLFLLPVPHGISEMASSLCRVEFDVRHEDYTGNPMKCTQIGSVSMSLKEIVDICSCAERAEKRIELKLFGNTYSKRQHKGGQVSCTDETIRDKKGNFNILAVRFRYASCHDMKFLQDLENGEKKLMKDASIWTSARNLLSDGNQSKVQIVTEKDCPKFITEMGVQDVGVGQLLRIFTKKAKRGKDGILRILVQPGPDPKRESTTTYLSEEELLDEMYKPSSNWIECGMDTKDSLGTVFLEILRCEGLPNMDSGESFGNKTDAFVCAIYEESMVQTDVIDDRLSPMWMPWSQRAFCFHIRHPLSQMFISVNDFDLGPSDHDGIGKIVVNLNYFQSDVVYTLKYNIHPASNIYDREDLGTITIRLRKHIKDPHVFLLASLKTPPRLHVNMKCEKTLPVANFTMYGRHNEDVYDVQLLRNYVNEILELKRLFFYCVGESVTSLALWRGQMKVGSLNLPVHSFIAFFGGIYVIERPHLLPGCSFLMMAWVMLASLINRLQHPSPWRKTIGFLDYLYILIHKTNPHESRRTIIKSMENSREAEIFEANWAHRIKSDYDAAWKEWELQLEMDRIGNQDLNTEHGEKAKDPIGIALASLKPRLFPIQKRLRGYCATLRQIRSVTSWEESIISFWVTLFCIITGVVLLILPTVFLLQWMCRLVIWLGLGPWARLYYDFIAATKTTRSELRNDQDREKDLMNKMKEIELKFQEKNHEARQKGEEALKLKSMRMLCFGKFIAKVPSLYTSRHYDYPLAQSEGAHISIALQHRIPPLNFDSRSVVPSQQFEGVMIPKVIIPKKVGESSSFDNDNIMSLAKPEVDKSEEKTLDCCMRVDDDTGSLNEYISFDDESSAEDYPKYSIVGTSCTKSRPSITIMQSVGEGNVENDHVQYNQDSPSGTFSVATLETSFTEISSYLEEEGIEIISTRATTTLSN